MQTHLAQEGPGRRCSCEVEQRIVQRSGYQGELMCIAKQIGQSMGTHVVVADEARKPAACSG